MFGIAILIFKVEPFHDNEMALFLLMNKSNSQLANVCKVNKLLFTLKIIYMSYFKIKFNGFFIPLIILLIFCVSCNSDLASPTKSLAKGTNAKLLQRGDQIQLGKEWDEVQNNYSKFTYDIAKNENNNTARIQLAQLYIKEARVTGEHGHYYPAALSVLEDALKNSELTNDLKFLALTTKAGVQLSLHDFKDALTTGNKAAMLNPSNAQVHGVLVDANVEMGNYEKAVALSDRMMMIKPDIRSYSRVSYLREIHGDIEGAKEAMMMAVKAGYPGTEETAWAMLTLGDIYKNYGSLDSAKLIYESILEMRPDYPFAVGGLGEVYLEKNDLKNAELKLNEAIHIIPEVGFYINLAHVYNKQNREEALSSIIDEILVMLKEDSDSGHNMNLEYADLYLHLLDNPKKAYEYANLEYLKRPKNIDVNLMMAEVSLALNRNANIDHYVQIASITNSANPRIEILMNKM